MCLIRAALLQFTCHAEMGAPWSEMSPRIDPEIVRSKEIRLGSPGPICLACRADDTIASYLSEAYEPGDEARQIKRILRRIRARARSDR